MPWWSVKTLQGYTSQDHHLKTGHAGWCFRQHNIHHCVSRLFHACHICSVWTWSHLRMGCQWRTFGLLCECQSNYMMLVCEHRSHWVTCILVRCYAKVTEVVEENVFCQHIFSPYRTQNWTVTHQFLECGMNGLFFPQVPIIEGNLFTKEKKEMC